MEREASLPRETYLELAREQIRNWPGQERGKYTKKLERRKQWEEGGVKAGERGERPLEILEWDRTVDWLAFSVSIRLRLLLLLSFFFALFLFIRSPFHLHLDRYRRPFEIKTSYQFFLFSRSSLFHSFFPFFSFSFLFRFHFFLFRHHYNTVRRTPVPAKLSPIIYNFPPNRDFIAYRGVSRLLRDETARVRLSTVTLQRRKITKK